MSSNIDEVIVLYNPLSTGNSKDNAHDLIKKLHAQAPHFNANVKETEYAGHAEVIAKEYAKKAKRVLLISSSGDGGYHELINGVLASGAKNVVTSLLPSGNANDHYRAVDSGMLVEHIIAHATHDIDVLEITGNVNGKKWIRFGHSYAGVGLSSVVGKELTKEKLNFFNEKWLVLKHLFKFRHISILVSGKKVRYSSLVFGNVAQMSKVIQLSKDSSMTDGKFEISAVRYESKFHLFKELFKAVTIGPKENSSVTDFSFKTIKKLRIQIDGEDYLIDANSAVEVRSVRKALQVIT
jgi:diacylglycerol kinase family enzyme